jgi:hypothetical protein
MCLFLSSKNSSAGLLAAHLLKDADFQLNRWNLTSYKLGEFEKRADTGIGSAHSREESSRDSEAGMIGGGRDGGSKIFCVASAPLLGRPIESVIHFLPL